MPTRLNVHPLAEPLPRRLAELAPLAERHAAHAAGAGLAVQVLYSNTFVDEAVGHSRGSGASVSAGGGAGAEAGRTQCGGLQQQLLCKRSFSRAGGSWQAESGCVASKVVAARTVTFQALRPHRSFLER